MNRAALISPVVRFFDANGKPLAGGFLYTYQAGTTTPLATYADSTTGAMNTNPVVLDSTGGATIFFGAGYIYKFVLQDANHVQQWTSDNNEEWDTTGGGGSLTISSFTSSMVGELGQSFVNPSFSASYVGTPTSANITNTDSIDSPHTLTSPYTSGTLIGTFTHSTETTTTFTLNATNGLDSPTATATFTWEPRIFGGVGASGATSSVTASGTTAVLSTSDVLASAGLGAETVGETFGPFTASGQCVYLLLLGGSHTFTDAGTGFPFAMNAPITVTFVNEYSVTVTMYLYQSINPLFGTYTPKIAS